MISRRSGITAVFIVTAIVILAAALAPRVPQPLSYHQFADRRAWLGIPNFGDVVSNLPFATVGIWGLWFIWSERGGRLFLDQRDRYCQRGGGTQASCATSEICGCTPPCKCTDR